MSSQFWGYPQKKGWDKIKSPLDDGGDRENQEKR
jgi:hypothetical protein